MKVLKWILITLLALAAVFFITAYVFSFFQKDVDEKAVKEEVDATADSKIDALDSMFDEDSTAVFPTDSLP